MKITVDLTEEDVRKLIAGKISNECSKHGHPAGMTPKVLVRAETGFVQGSVIPLEQLQVTIHAEVEVS